MIQLSEFFQYPFVLILKQKCRQRGEWYSFNYYLYTMEQSALWTWVWWSWWADERQLQLLGKAVHVYTWCDITARLTLEMGYKEISRVIYAMHNIAGRHNDVPTEMAPGPILAYPIGDILLSTLPSLANGLCNDTLVLNECQAWLPRACYSQWARCKHWRLAV